MIKKRRGRPKVKTSDVNGALRLFSIGAKDTLAIPWEDSPTGKDSNVVSVPIDVSFLDDDEEVGSDDDDESLAIDAEVNRNCAHNMECWQYKIRHEYDCGMKEEQGELLPEDVDLSLSSSVLKPISRDIAKPFIEKYEWLGTLGTYKFGYGLYFGYKLGVVVCFSKTTTWQAEVSICGEEYRDKVILLCRGAAANWAPPNANSHAVSQALKAVENDTQYRIVLAYSDRRAGEVGTIYQALNWNFIGWGATGNDHVPKALVDPSDMRFHTRGLPKHLKSKKSLEEAGYEVLTVPRANKGRYVTFLGSKKERKELLNALRWEILPYPKRSDFENLDSLTKFNAKERKR